MPVNLISEDAARQELLIATARMLLWLTAPEQMNVSGEGPSIRMQLIKTLKPFEPLKETADGTKAPVPE